MAIRKIRRITPFQAGKLLGILYFCFGLIFVPFLIIFAIVGAHAAPKNAAFPAIFGLGFAIMAPVIYGAMGFIGGIIGAAVYNLAARFVGGIEVEVE